MFIKNKLSRTLGRVTTFISSLEEGIKDNEDRAHVKQVEISAITEEVSAINAESAAARKLLAKLQ